MGRGPLLRLAILSSLFSNAHAQASSPPPPIPSCEAYRTFTDTEVSGTYLGGVAASPSVSNCCEECNDKADCTAFVEFNGHCYLKGADASVGANLEGRTAFMRMMPPPPPSSPSACGLHFDAPLQDTEMFGTAGVVAVVHTGVEDCCTEC